ncbi:flagellar radial spoke protein 3 [Folsomia candida]|uniref:flagellar radial spoke protein 3 n=1 Tax=Folsomia candida TaxID=158441 RepID=UPI001604A292|nr:flagellar radial spoke protein 3 [Folsomia candida]
MMWDPRIYRGPTYKTFKKSEEERCKRRTLEDASASNAQRKKGMTKRKIQQTNMGGIIRPRTPPHHTSKIGLEDMGIQTDRYLEEITDEVVEKDMFTQTDQIFDLPVLKIFCPFKLGLDVETQIQPWELFRFDDEVTPVVTTVVGKIIEQALFETMEEVELESLLSQQRAFEERHRIELMRLHRLHQREQKITAERERLIAQRQKEVMEEKETQNIVTANFYSANLLGTLNNNALNELRRQGFMSGNDDLNDTFIPWLHARSIRKVGIREKSSVLLDEIIQAVVDKREAEVADGIWREISAENKRILPQEYSEDYGEGLEE